MTGLFLQLYKRIVKLASGGADGLLLTSVTFVSTVNKLQKTFSHRVRTQQSKQRCFATRNSNAISYMKKRFH